MQFGTIASGSSGNCLYVGGGGSHVLIDAGISGRRIFDGLNQFGVSPEQIDGILITHEHIDHIAGLGVVMRKVGCHVYATEKTIREILSAHALGAMPADLFTAIEPDHPFVVGGLEIEPFRMSHDAKDPVSYVVKSGKQQIGMVTDLGIYDQYTVAHLQNSHVLYIEANHDIHMLQAGSYPYYLKRRILSEKGHLCNEMAGQLIKELMHDQLKKVVLGHLSKENNYPELALATVRQETGLFNGAQFSMFEPDYTDHFKAEDIVVAPRDRTSELIII